MYKIDVIPYFKQFMKIKLNRIDIEVLEDFATELIKEKKEEQYKVDNDKLYKRYLNGLKGEKALEKYLNIPIIDFRIGRNTDFHAPDIRFLNLGIKTVEYGKYPIIFKENNYSQIINILDTDLENVYICGIANYDMLNTFQNDNYILDKNLRIRNTKTCYTNFKDLVPIVLLKNHIEKMKEGF